jgi:predicted acylesterase/phospholipase RssA
MTSGHANPFDQIVFAGGGNRCWWQAGWWDTVAPELQLRPRVIAAISAGAATACMVYAHDSHQTMDYYREVLSNNRRNAYWGNLLRNERVFPH